MKKIILIMLILITLVSLSACVTENETNSYSAKVLSERTKSSSEEGGYYYITQYLTIEFTDGPHKGETYEAIASIDATNYTDVELYRAGDAVKAEVYVNDSGDVDYVSVTTFIRAPYVLILAALFLVLVGVIGKFKGLRTIIALVFTVSAVVFVLVPMISGGYDPILSATLVCIVISVVTMFTVGGLNRKSLSSVLGTICGLVCAAAVTLLFSSLMRITGMDTSEVGLLMQSDASVVFNYKGILTAGILIGCIGAVMDVGMSISSSINEMYTINPALSQKKLFRSGMSVGRDIIGTMANTLILAYTGGSLMLMVVWSVYGVSFVDMLNKGFIVIEVAKSLCGSIGMVMTIPLTALIASHLVRKEEKES